MLRPADVQSSSPFAIGNHLANRSKAIGASPLDDIMGVGAERKRALLAHFGSAKAVARANLAGLEAVLGVSKGMAQKLYDKFQPS
jgi:excinuclease ABC subunit C